MDPRALVGAAVATIAGGVPDDIRADYLDCYAGDRYVESMRTSARYPEELPALAEVLPEIATPVTLVNGRHDPVVPLANVEFLDARLPDSRVVIIDAGHFVWEEAPAEYASPSSTPSHAPRERHRDHRLRRSVQPTSHDRQRASSTPTAISVRATSRWCCCSTSAATSTTGTRP